MTRLVKYKTLWLLAIVALSIYAPDFFADTDTKSLRVTAVTDADSLRAGDLRLRLYGIDAPELRQTCLDKASQPYRCGEEAADSLRKMIEIGAEIQCQHLDTDRYKRWVVKCFHNGEDIGEAVVRAGWALAYRRYAKDYIEAENQAERAGRGIWQGSLTRPEIWRREQRKK